MSDIKCPFCNLDIRTHRLFVDGCDNTHSPLWQELMSTRKALEQSEICCTEWEKQALDYKAENIALSGDLERARKALDRAKLILKNLLPDLNGYERLDVEKAITEITALEQKDK